MKIERKEKKAERTRTVTPHPPSLPYKPARKGGFGTSFAPLKRWTVRLRGGMGGDVGTQGWGIILLLLLAAACTPQQEPFSPIPELKVLSISPAAVQEFQNQVILELEYLDYDGDLGSENPDEKTLWVQDSRLDSADWYHVPPIAPIGEEVAVRGTFTVPMNRLFLLGNGQSETLFFTLKIKDRAGNWSEEEITETITVTR